jgi:asparagine synthase (glutamine-hydrolysing)
VVLSGDGGDELFAGYDKYAVEAKERRYGLPSPLRKILHQVARVMPHGMKGRNLVRHMSLPHPQRYLDSLTLFRRTERRNLFQDDLYPMIFAHDPYLERKAFFKQHNEHWLSALQALDLKTYLPLDILTKVDRMSMAHSLEVRPALLDHKLLEFVATIPPEMLVHRGERKHIFKTAMRGLLPQEILSRPKQGFAVPLGRWFRGKLEGYVRDLLLSPRARQRGIIQPAYVERLLSLHSRGKELDLHLWTLISFELWCRTFLDRCPTQLQDIPVPANSCLLSSSVN